MEDSLLLIAPFVCPFAEVQVEGTHRTAAPAEGHFEFLGPARSSGKEHKSPRPVPYKKYLPCQYYCQYYFTPVAPCKKGMFCTLNNTTPKQKWV